MSGAVPIGRQTDAAMQCGRRRREADDVETRGWVSNLPALAASAM